MREKQSSPIFLLNTYNSPTDLIMGDPSTIDHSQNLELTLYLRSSNEAALKYLATNSVSGCKKALPGFNFEY